jgi:zinc/manganese transport system permease protein
MLGQEFMRNALLAGTFVALACGLCGWFVVLRRQVFAGDALGHVAFPGALAAAAAGVDQRAGLFAATVIVAAALAGLARAAPGGGHGSSAALADDTLIGIAFTFVLGLGVLFLTIFSASSGGAGGIQAARTLFGSIFGLGSGEATLAAAIGGASALALLAIARPLLFASVSPGLAAARGVRTRLLEAGFLALLGIVAAEAAQAIGALLLLGLLVAPAAAAHRLTARPLAGIGLAAALAVASTWLGLMLSYELPSLPPSTAVVAVAVALTALSALPRRGRGPSRPRR